MKIIVRKDALENKVMDLVSVIIPTYNRFHYLLDTIKSVKEQTYTNTEIIVINDCSTQEEYYTYDFKSQNVHIIHLKENTRKIYPYPCAGHVRNEGIKVAKGKYVAFCDDDDIWYPEKLEKQIAAMKKIYTKMSCTDGHIGNGRYNPSQTYKLYLQEFYYDYIKRIYEKAYSNFVKNGFPYIFDLASINIHNCIICSSVVVEKELLDSVDRMPLLRNGEEDIGCWKRLLKHTGCYFVSDPCVYYDNAHGDGRAY